MIYILAINDVVLLR